MVLSYEIQTLEDEESSYHTAPSPMVEPVRFYPINNSAGERISDEMLSLIKFYDSAHKSFVWRFCVPLKNCVKQHKSHDFWMKKEQKLRFLWIFILRQNQICLSVTAIDTNTNGLFYADFCLFQRRTCLFIVSLFSPAWNGLIRT